jgi:polynucleotide 5'-hydroxyl-kinase GRC3/NOL9
VVPPEWRALLSGRLTGTIVLIGWTDSGKTTLARWLVDQLSRQGQKVGWIDADVGQSTLGVPTTANLALVEPGADAERVAASFFVGSTSPKGHMLPAAVGAFKLREHARTLGGRTVVVDTTGLVDERSGGGALKQSHILDPLRAEPWVHVTRLSPSEAAKHRTREARARRRVELFRRYFSSAAELGVPAEALPVYTAANAAPGRLLALQDRFGLALGLGVLVHADAQRFRILTPVRDMSALKSLRFGSISVDPASGAHAGGAEGSLATGLWAPGQGRT